MWCVQGTLETWRKPKGLDEGVDAEGYTPPSPDLLSRLPSILRLSSSRTTSPSSAFKLTDSRARKGCCVGVLPSWRLAYLPCPILRNIDCFSIYYAAIYIYLQYFNHEQTITMAAILSMSSPIRQPFGSLDGARLRNLTNTKNRQNGMSHPLIFTTSPGTERSNLSSNLSSQAAKLQLTRVQLFQQLLHLL